MAQRHVWNSLKVGRTARENQSTVVLKPRVQRIALLSQEEDFSDLPLISILLAWHRRLTVPKRSRVDLSGKLEEKRTPGVVSVFLLL